MTSQKVLIIRPDRVGDVILASSCLPAVRRRFPKAQIFFAARAGMQPLFEGHPLITDFVPLPDAKLSFFRRVLALRQTFRAMKITSAVSLHPDAAVYLAARWARVRVRIGYPLRWFSWTLTRRVKDRRRASTSHESDYNFDPLRPLGIALPTRLRAHITLPDRCHDSLLEKLGGERPPRPYVCLHPTAHSTTARWPVASFLDLARHAIGRGASIVLVGRDADDPAHAAFRKEADFPFLDMTGKLDLGELGVFLQNAAALVTRDTGPSHLAAAVGCPVVVLFGRLTPPYGTRRWAPLADRHKLAVVTSEAAQHKTEPRHAFHARAFAEIPVEKVAEALDRFIMTS